MTRSIVQSLILKDCRLHRTPILVSIGAGLVALGIFQIRSETTVVLGSIWFFVSLIVLGSMLPNSNVTNERKKQNLPFLMSLPVSSIQYTTAKLVSSVVMFLIPWLTLLIAMLYIIIGRGVLPQGAIPAALILITLPFIGFCVIFATALVSESEGWGIAATVVCNSSYGLGWYFMAKNPAIAAGMKSAVPIWNSTIFSVLGGQFALIALILLLTYYLQSRKRDFV